ncbi:MAG: hypothetical protein WD875_06110 [Pirellulales bacterium]
MEVSSDTAATDTAATEAANSEAEAASQPFMGRWHLLVSTTNWEKGRIICEWRQTLIDADADAAEYSDEAWATHVGGVTSQHVGRLRRVYGRFGATYASYEGLYWSHFQAALDWEDAEMWLEGAMQNDWSVSEMRRQRTATLGDVTASRADQLAAQLDTESTAEQAAAEESASGDDRITPSVARLQASDIATSDKKDELNAAATDDTEDGDDDGENTNASRRNPPVQPFAELPELPDDLQAAFDTFKLAILNHRREGWQEVSCDDVLATLDALKALAAAPLED